MAHGDPWAQTKSVRPGKLVVGQSQGVFGGGFTVGNSFEGKVASLNIWSTKMANSVIKEKAKSCSRDLGNVVDWRTFRHGSHGNAEILSPQSCTSHGKRKSHTTALYSTPLHCTLLHSTPLHSTPLHSTPLHSTPLHSTPPFELSPCNSSLPSCTETLATQATFYFELNNHKTDTQNKSCKTKFL